MISLKSGAKLFSGQVLTSIVSLATIPYLAKIYSIEEFGFLGLLQSIILIIGSVSGLRLETSLVENYKSTRMKKIKSVFFVMVLIVNSISLAIVALLLNLSWELMSFLLAGGVSIGLISYIEKLLLAKARNIEFVVLQSGKVILPVIFHIAFRDHSWYLMIIGFCLAHFLLSLIFSRYFIAHLFVPRIKDIREVLITERKYTGTILSTTLVSQLNERLPLIVFGGLEPSLGGLLNIASKITIAPLSAFYGFLRNLFFKVAFEEESLSLKAFTKKYMALNLVLLGSLCVFLVSISEYVSDTYFNHLDGLEMIVRLLAIYACSKVMLVPLSAVLIKLNHHKEILIINSVRLALSIAVVVGYFFGGFNSDILLYTLYLVSSLTYIIHSISIWKKI